MTESNASHPVPDMDPVASSRWRRRPRKSSPWLHEEVGRRMASRLDWIKLQPQHWGSWSPMLGGLQAHQAVAVRYPAAACQLLGEQADTARTVLGLAPTPQTWKHWWSRWTGKQEMADGPPPLDLLWANMALHLYERPDLILRRWHTLLRTDGFLMFSCLGPDTFREIRQVYAASGWAPASHGLTDMHDWGDMLVETGFAEPVMDMERLTLTYPRVEGLLDDLRAWGRNLHADRSASVRSRAFRHHWLKAMELLLPRTADGQFYLTVEVIYGHAIKPTPRVKMGQTTQVSLDDMKTLLRKSGRGVGGATP